MNVVCMVLCGSYSVSQVRSGTVYPGTGVYNIGMVQLQVWFHRKNEAYPSWHVLRARWAGEVSHLRVAAYLVAYCNRTLCRPHVLHTTALRSIHTVHCLYGCTYSTCNSIAYEFDSHAL